MDEKLGMQDEKTLLPELNYLPFFNLALQQNGLPIVYELKLKNQSGNELKDLECVFSSEPDFVVPKVVNAALVHPGEELVLHDLGVELNYTKLLTVTDKLKAKLKLEIKKGEEVFFQKDYDVDVLAPDLWLGCKILPELICSFVTPNLEVITWLLGSVANELEKATGSSAITGYQSGERENVYQLCMAIFRSIHDLGVHYSNPPASFGIPGQKIRFADTIYKYKLGTCLDTTLLFASVMEACQLHPVIMLQDGHAYIGCHLREHYFADTVMDDLQVIRKLVDLDEFLVLETTKVTGSATFSEAEAFARNNHLNIDDFECTIDVIRARYSGIQPLPIRNSTDGLELDPVEHKAKKLGKEQKRNLQQEIDLSKLSDIIPQSGRVVRWQQKLLDLSLRNRLLNVKDSKLVVPIACPDIASLEDRISANETLSLNPLPNLLGEKDLHDMAMLRNSEVKNEIRQLLEKELSQKRLWSLLTPYELGRRLITLYRQCKADIEEGGVNTIFLAIGFLEWKQSERDERSYLAPILLIPVRICRKSMVEGITISRLDEDTIINVTLLEMLHREYKLQIPGLDPLPTDQSGVDVPRIMQIIRQTVKDMKGWEVREEARLGYFSFSKFIMWNDLTQRINSLKQNPLVKHLIEGNGIFNDGIEVFPQQQIGQYLDIRKLYCPMSADASQLTAVIYSEMGKSFVLHGPPGTGKSQTITNIIAHNLACGKRVLFVSEKKAALDVVHKRLSAIGLRPFCLELHSNKSGKTEILKQFKEVIELADKQSPCDWDAVLSQMETARNELNLYVRELHKKYPCGFTPYTSFSWILVHPDIDKNALPGLNISVSETSAETIRNMRNAAEELESCISRIPRKSLETFSLLECMDWTPAWEKNVIESCQNVHQIAVDLRDKCHKLFPLLGYEKTLSSMNEIYSMAFVADTLRHSPKCPDNFYSENWPEQKQTLQNLIHAGRSRDEFRKKLRESGLSALVKANSLGGTKERLSSAQTPFAVFRSCLFDSEEDAPTNTPSWIITWHEACRNLRNAYSRLSSAWKDMTRLTGISCQEPSELALSRFLDLFQMLGNTPDYPNKFFEGEWRPFADTLHKMIEAGRIRDFTQDSLADFNPDSIKFFDTADAAIRLENNKTKNFLFRFFAERILLSKFHALLTNRKRNLNYVELSELNSKMTVYITNQKRIDSATMEFSLYLGAFWNKGYADWDVLEKLLQFGNKIDSAIHRIYADDHEKYNDLWRQIGKFVGEMKDNTEKTSAFEQNTTALRNAWEEYISSFDHFCNVLKTEKLVNEQDVAGGTLLEMFTSKGPTADGHSPAVELDNILQNMQKLLAVQNLISIQMAPLKQRLEPWQQDDTYVWEELQGVVDSVSKIDEAVEAAGQDAYCIRNMRNSIGKLLPNAKTLLDGNGTVLKLIRQMISGWNDFSGEPVRKLISLLSIEKNFLEDSPGCVEHYINLTEFVCAQAKDLRNWCLWRKCQSSAAALHLGQLVSAVENAAVSNDKITCTLEAMFHCKFIDEILNSVETLRTFLGTHQEETITRFRALDDRYIAMSKDVVIAKLITTLPRRRTGSCPEGTELGILKRECEKRARQKPIRQLLELIPTLVPILKPCFLMSPLSVAQYLPADNTVFDLIIFDEASQIPVWDAIGVIARGKQMIVVGDPKQMPPTNFFQKGENTEETDQEQEETVDDMESILDECLAAGVNSTHLNWHYRSRHESLISFSNHHYYEDRLFTFPSANNPDTLGVHFKFVPDGIYDRKATRTNQKEAEKLVAYIFNRFENPKLRSKSIGVVTFSQAQRDLIDDMVEQHRSKHPETEKFFSDTQDEPFFVKNLENVQGDERDVILFSICYAPDAEGKFSMNFGPLNRQGGERRLNVAITRAKEQVIVFSSIKAPLIEMTRTNALGAVHLKYFLDYAEKGTQIQSAENVAEMQSDGLVDTVAEFLGEKGYSIRRNVGSSGYKINLAVFSPEKPDRYLLGIECDGISYSRQTTTRDRDHLRASVLKSLGWKMYRIWCVDWLLDRANAEQALLKTIENVEFDGIEPEAEIIPEPKAETSPEVPQKEKDAVPENRKIYVLWKDETTHEQDAFYENYTRSLIREQIAALIQIESPLCESMIRKRIVKAWNFNRAGDQIQNILTACLPLDGKVTHLGDQEVYWSSGQDSSAYKDYRVPASNSERRGMDEIPPEELANAMYEILTDFQSCEQDTLYRETVKLFGFASVTAKMRKYLEYGIKVLRQAGRI